MHRYRLPLVLNLAVAIMLQSTAPLNLHAQFKKTAMKLAFCGGGALGGYKLGQKLAEAEAKKMKFGAEEAEKHRRAFEIGMALALCGGGTLIAGTVYSRLSKRDLDARQKEMDAALADAAPTSRSYVLPESKLQGTLQTEAVESDGNKECRSVIDTLAESSEPAMARYCRKPPDGRYQLDL